MSCVCARLCMCACVRMRSCACGYERVWVRESKTESLCELACCYKGLSGGMHTRGYACLQRAWMCALHVYSTLCTVLFWCVYHPGRMRYGRMGTRTSRHRNMAGVDGKMQYKEAPSRRWAAAAAEQVMKGTAFLRVQTHVRVSGRAERRFLCFHGLEFCP